MKLLPLVNEEVQEGIHAMQTHIRDLAAGLHGVAHQLHPVFEDLGLAAAIQAMAADYRSAGMEIIATVRGVPPDVPLSIATALYRIAQEALHNAQQHGEGAGVRLRCLAAKTNFDL